MPIKQIDDIVFMQSVMRIHQAKNFAECFTILTEYIMQNGFDGILYTYTPFMLNHKPTFHASDGYNPSYLQYYDDRNLVLYDHVVKSVINGENRVINWFEDAENIELKNESLFVLESSRDFGLRNGISFATLSSHYAFAGVSIICKKDDAYFKEICLANLDMIKIFVEIFHQKVTSKSYHHSIFLKPALNSLSISKRQILVALANGKNIKSIAGELQLNEKYVSNIVSALPREFGCKSRDQLMYVAGVLELGGDNK